MTDDLGKHLRRQDEQVPPHSKGMPRRKCGASERKAWSTPTPADCVSQEVKVDLYGVADPGDTSLEHTIGGRRRGECWLPRGRYRRHRNRLRQSPMSCG